MNRMTLAAIGLAVLVFVGIMGYRMGHEAHVLTDSPLGADRPASSPAFNDELQKIRAAEMIEDPAKRCLAYPEPHEFAWDAVQVQQLCRKSLWQMLTWREINKALDDHHPEKIDAAFDAYAAQNFTDPERHGFLTWTFWWMFQNSSADVLATTQRWIEIDPNSSYAWAARGIHYSQAAYDARGGKKASNTSSENFSRMRKFIDASRTDLEKSLRLNPRLIAAYHGLIRIERLEGLPDDALNDVIKRALTLDDADPWIYQDWLDNVEPQWGGSTIEMQRVAQQAASHANKNPLLKTLQAEPLCNTADEYRCTECKRDGAKSLDFYKQAGGFGPSACFLEHRRKRMGAFRPNQGDRGQSEEHDGHVQPRSHFRCDASNR